MARDDQVRRALDEGVGTRKRQIERAEAGEEIHRLLGDMIADAEAEVLAGSVGQPRPIMSALWDAIDPPREEDPLVAALLRAAIEEADR